MADDYLQQYESGLYNQFDNKTDFIESLGLGPVNE